MAANLATGESELNRSTKEFESAREEAYKKANIGSAITKESISKILMAQNFSMPAGYIEENLNKFAVKVGDKVKNIEELNNLVLFNMEPLGIGIVKISDVASVEMDDNSETLYTKINGNDGIILTIQKQSNASTSKISKNINKNINDLIEKNPKVNIVALQDQGVYIDFVISSVIKNLVLGGILAIIILLLFLKNLKPTIIIAVTTS